MSLCRQLDELNKIKQKLNDDLFGGVEKPVEAKPKKRKRKVMVFEVDE